MVSREGSIISEGGTRRTAVVTSSMLLDKINRDSIGGMSSYNNTHQTEEDFPDSGPARDPSEPWLDEDHMSDTQRFVDTVDNHVADYIVQQTGRSKLSREDAV